MFFGSHKLTADLRAPKTGSTDLVGLVGTGSFQWDENGATVSEGFFRDANGFFVSKAPVAMLLEALAATDDKPDGAMRGAGEKTDRDLIETLAETDGVLTGIMEKPVGVKTIRVLVTVATGTLEVPVRVQMVRVSVTVAGEVDVSFGVSGTIETLVETTTEVDGTTEMTGMTEMDVSIFLVAERLEAKSTLELASPSVILPLR